MLLALSPSVSAFAPPSAFAVDIRISRYCETGSLDSTTPHHRYGGIRQSSQYLRAG